jgi:prepilin-type processing-associated H-X9-DG protein
MANKATSPVGGPLVDGGAGGTFRAWGVFDNSWWPEEGDYGSYGINAWVYNRPKSAVNQDFYWCRADVKGASKVPLLLDCCWPEDLPRHTHPLPAYEGELASNPGGGGNMRFCLNRHNGAVNGVFLDFSVRKIGLKELWKLKWHRKFDTNAKLPNWPEWMKKFKK